VVSYKLYAKCRRPRLGRIGIPLSYAVHIPLGAAKLAAENHNLIFQDERECLTGGFVEKNGHFSLSAAPDRCSKRSHSSQIAMHIIFPMSDQVVGLFQARTFRHMALDLQSGFLLVPESAVFVGIVNTQPRRTAEQFIHDRSPMI